MTDISQYIIPNEIGIVMLDCETAFNGLTDKEKLYAHYISQASWYGGLICLLQTSPESPGIFLLFQKVFRGQDLTELQTAAEAQGVTKDEFQAFLVYTAGFLSNSGNYKSFGDSKFIPNLPKEKFHSIVMCSKAAMNNPADLNSLWENVSDRLYSLAERQKELGLGEKGTTTYYSSNCDMKDAKIAQEFMNAKDISPYNTRLFKTQFNEKVCYEVRLASADSSEGVIPGVDENILGYHEFTPKETGEPCRFKVTRGDYSALMALIVENLTKAAEYAANETEKKMLNEYVQSFTTGSIPKHKDGSRYWIKNKGPVVETYIGFIESYRDPFGVRGEFEGFVAVVNKEMSTKFTELVNQAEHLLPLLPWPAAYEKDKFLRPDFTSLDVLTFGGSGIPAGINIPNYDDIRQNEGFKNVSLGNVLTSGYKDRKANFLDDNDKALCTKLKIAAFEVQVGLHELLGHGSGKLFIKNEDGSYNFDQENVTNDVTGEKIMQCYNFKETWDTRFSTLSSSYEECRAECVGIYLCLSTDALRIFGFTDESADDIIYVNWLTMAQAGLLGLEFYSPETGEWRQAHMQARFCILRVMLEAGHGFVTVTKTTADDGKEDILLKLDRSKIRSVGKPAIGAFLKKIQVYKSIGDVDSAKKMYDYYSDVHDRDDPHFLSLRSIVLDRKQPRKMFVQHNTQVVNGNNVLLKKYESSAAGLINSIVDRFPNTDLDEKIDQLWSKEKPYFLD